MCSAVQFPLSCPLVAVSSLERLWCSDPSPDVTSCEYHVILAKLPWQQFGDQSVCIPIFVDYPIRLCLSPCRHGAELCWFVHLQGIFVSQLHEENFREGDCVPSGCCLHKWSDIWRAGHSGFPPTVLCHDTPWRTMAWALALCIVAATTLGHFARITYLHRSKINRLRKQGLVSSHSRCAPLDSSPVFTIATDNHTRLCQKNGAGLRAIFLPFRNMSIAFRLTLMSISQWRNLPANIAIPRYSWWISGQCTPHCSWYMTPTRRSRYQQSTIFQRQACICTSWSQSLEAQIWFPWATKSGRHGDPSSIQALALQPWRKAFRILSSVRRSSKRSSRRGRRPVSRF